MLLRFLPLLCLLFLSQASLAQESGTANQPEVPSPCRVTSPYAQGDAYQDCDQALRDADRAIQNNDQALRDADRTIQNYDQALRDADRAIQNYDEALPPEPK